MGSRLMSVEGAARRVGVSPQRVRVWISDGRLPAERVGRSYVIDGADLARVSRRPRQTGRRLSGRNAWALLALLSGLPAGDVAERSLFRLQALLRGPSDALVKALRHAQPRSELHAWRVLPADLGRLSDDRRVVRSGLAADLAQLDVRYDRVRDGLDVYVDRYELERLERQLRPITDSEEPNLRLRVPLYSAWVLEEEVAPLPVVAADLIEDDDPRVRRAAENALKAARGD